MSTTVTVNDVFGDTIRVSRVQKVENHPGPQGVVRIDLNDGGSATWIGTRAQFLELTRAMTEIAVALTP